MAAAATSSNDSHPPNGANRLEQLIQGLAEAQQLLTEGQPCSTLEIAETLWLAMRIEPTVPLVEETIPPPAPPPPPSDSIVTGEEPPGGESPPITQSDSTASVDVAVPTQQVGVLPPKTLPIRLADPAMLTDSLAVIQALKPLIQNIAAMGNQRLNESATVENIARTQLCLPVMEPEQQAWFDVVLVVDRGSSMHIWQRLVCDIRRILRSYGAFRNVQVFDLAVDVDLPLEQSVQLISQPDRPAHHYRELIDQQGRRIVMVLSDCAGVYWWDGRLLPMLQVWGKVMPLVIWQMLPAWMWKRTALGRGTAVAITNDLPGVANQRLRTRMQERQMQEREAAEDDRQQRLPMPVVTSELGDLAAWSRMVTGNRREITPGFLLPRQGGMVPRLQGSEVEPTDRVRRFIALASPEAQRLVMLLAAAPVITLPVMRLIRDAMLADVSSPLPVAEVFLSGLLRPLAGQDTQAFEALLQQAEGDRVQELAAQDLRLPDGEMASFQLATQDFIQYDFVAQVRDVLLEVLPAIDTIDVINCVSAVVEQRWNQVSDQDFRAFLTDPTVTVSPELSGLRSFASVTADILKRAGGDYAQFVQQLRYGAGETFPLKDLEYEVAKFLDFPVLQTCEYESATIATILDRVEFETATIERGRGRWQIQRRGGANYRYTEILRDAAGEEVGLDMMAIPGGSFMMGAPKGEVSSSDRERPQHQVTLAPFYLGQYPVTQAQWRVVAGYPTIDCPLNPDPSRFKGNDRPVEQVSWEEAQEFCRRLSVQTGQDYRLSSEAQWEYACRSGTTTPFCFGEIITTELANYDGNYTYNKGPKGEYRKQTTAIGAFPASDWGLYDMHGNVWEWCEDDWHPNYEGAPVDGSAWVESDRNNARKLLRGGSWGSTPDYCRSAVRDYNSRDLRSSNVGFRVSFVLPRTFS
jgi:formylglycine-generating enzyme required for sulfatase activity